ncbi:MAG TPA: DsbA family protein [Solirubrobacterales bacterium]|nr:DsbA family protein [Solirubrobacterales bacterium]
MTQNTKVTFAVVFLFVLGGLIFMNTRDSGGPVNSDAAENPKTVRADSHMLSTAEDDKVNLVEFLDFECEACKAQFPTMERIREEYEGRINFVVRYFPLSGHGNAENAARAVEAASKQDAFEEMYVKMYETQSEWGESQDSKEDLFVEFARELGLDEAQFVADVNDPKTAERIAKDQQDGVGLGVQGTPTIFLNDEELPSMPPYELLKERIDALLAE